MNLMHAQAVTMFALVARGHPAIFVLYYVIVLYFKEHIISFLHHMHASYK